MDPRGQRLSEVLFVLCLLLGITLGVWRAASSDDVRQVLRWYMASAAAGLLLCVPDWPMYNRQALPWQPCQRVAAEKLEAVAAEIRLDPALKTD
ncbi:hypothetical protein CDCA_CDCA06G1983 [Cyanidium caldarium]|uniref:Signal peptidase complex subunit 1 n=1 Tax=Cyanidium caldarium TaxID=2771 RepID=A0AAV9IV55_CYACA|nr:hypothetical protein CDCA_CDCA06G1983 [Cyanidium caldarium]